MADGGGSHVYEGWLEKSTDATKQKGLLSLKKSSSSWKKLYFVLQKERDKTENKEYSVLIHYEKKPVKPENANRFKGKTKLWPHYKIEKCFGVKGKHYVFAITTPDEKLRLNAENEINLDLWVFYLQMQTKLRVDLPGSCFIVTATETDDHRKIGTLGAKCLLHLSPWGVTLALQNSRCLVGQWPLKCVRSFESSDDGRFNFEAGRSSPMGEGDYQFLTLPSEDNFMFDLLDQFTAQSNKNLKSITESRRNSKKEIDEVAEEYDCLRLATFGLLPTPVSEQLSVSACIDVPAAAPRPALHHQISSESSEARYHVYNRPESIYLVEQSTPALPERPTNGLKIMRSPLENSAQLNQHRAHPMQKSELHRLKDDKGSYIDMSQTNLSSFKDEDSWWNMSGEFRSPSDSMSPHGETGKKPIQLEQIDASFKLEPSGGAVKKNASKVSNPGSVKKKRASGSPYEHMTSPAASYENTTLQHSILSSYENSPLIKPSNSFKSYENEAFVNSPSSFTRSLPKRFHFKDRAQSQDDSVIMAPHTPEEYSNLNLRRTGKVPPYLELEEESKTPILFSPPFKLARSASCDNLFERLSLSPGHECSSIADRPLPDWLPHRRLPAPPPGTVHLRCMHSYLDIDIKGIQVNRDKRKKFRRHNYVDIDGDSSSYEHVRPTLNRSYSDSNILGDLPPPLPDWPPSQNPIKPASHSTSIDIPNRKKSSKNIVKQVSTDGADESAASSAPINLVKSKSPSSMKGFKTSSKTKMFTKSPPETELSI
ncbi:uncharacterized protein LOC100374214 [Saccoglossus kowalevskii]|uniref:Uncharacterized protein LOC100374214 n=1 Tax=Saccoglossus kowalevskii TaxID=10224 RepID=A0ABM0GKD0_SACKO|nr:PREDICTED: uncharacterized protein LOC100374214 [Saccoglossus kowalevskii]